MGNILNKPEQTYKRKILRNNSTLAEIILWKRLKKRQVAGAKFRRQFGIDEFIVDFYCPKLRLIIEVDGSIHQQEDILEKDLYKQRFFESLGLFVLRLSNDQVLNNIDLVIKGIKDTIEFLSSQRSEDGGGTRRRGGHSC